MSDDLTEKLRDLSNSLSKFGDPRCALVALAVTEIETLRERVSDLEKSQWNGKT